MASLSPRQIRDINSLYESIYTQQPIKDYLDEDEIRYLVVEKLNDASESYLTENLSPEQKLTSEQIAAVVEIIVEMNLKLQKGERLIEEVLSGSENIHEIKGFLAKQLPKITGFGLRNLKRLPKGEARRLGTMLGLGFGGKVADDKTGSNVQRLIANLGHGLAGGTAGLLGGFKRGFLNQSIDTIKDKEGNIIKK